MATNIWFWVLFNLFVISMLALDLGIFNKKSHKVGTKEAILWSIMWISLALLFNLGLWFFEGREIALQFLGGYLLEKSLSVDNIFVFVMIFTYFGVQSQYQHRVLRHDPGRRSPDFPVRNSDYDLWHPAHCDCPAHGQRQ
jgi:tellurite resistance protein TerC